MQIAACKKRELLEPLKLPNSVKKLDTEAIQSAKEWFSQESTNFRTKKANARNVGIDSIPFVPMWEYAQTFHLPDSSKLVVSPVYRYRKVQYNPNLGFLRLIAIHLRADYSLIDGKILEIIGDKSVIPHYGINATYQFYAQIQNNLPIQIYSFSIEDRIAATYSTLLNPSNSKVESAHPTAPPPSGCSSGWGISVSGCNVSFIDCDGSVLYSYTSSSCGNMGTSLGSNSNVYLEEIPDGTMVGGGGGSVGIDYGMGNTDITIDNYPGKDNGFPYQWWADEEWLDNNFNLSLDTPQGGRLTAREKALIAMFPVQAYLISRNIEPARNETVNIYGNNGLNDKSDAFRHAYFSALNARDVGVLFARLFGEAHESEVPSQLSLEKEMDLHNNEQGYTAYSQNSGSLFSPPPSNELLSAACHTKALMGLLVYLDPLSNTMDPFDYYNNPTGTNNIIPGTTVLVPSDR